MCTELFCKKKTWFSALFFWRYVWHLTMLHTLTCIKIMIYLSVFWQKVDGMGWLWLVGSFKLHVSFAEYSLVYRARLQKRPVILRSLRIVATPYLSSAMPYFAEYSLFYRALLQKSLTILRGLLIVATPYLSSAMSYFAEYSLFYRALLQKRPTILRSLLIDNGISFRFSFARSTRLLYVYLGYD